MEFAATSLRSFFRFLRAAGLRGDRLGRRGADGAATTRGGVDLTEGVLTVRAGKRGRTRLLPLHPTAIAPLRDYTNEREQRYGPPPGDAAFFRTDRSDHIDYSSAQSTFQRLRQ